MCGDGPAFGCQWDLAGSPTKMGTSNRPPTEPPAEGRPLQRDSEPPGGGWIVGDLIPVQAHGGGTPLGRPPPTVDELNAEGLIAPENDPYCYLNEEERAIAQWLADRALTGVRSVRARDRPGEPTPDAVFDRDERLATIEMKTLKSPSDGAVYNGLRYGRRQSRIVVIDGRPTGITPDIATSGLHRAARIHGVDIDQAIIVVTDGPALGWKP